MHNTMINAPRVTYKLSWIMKHPVLIIIIYSMFYLMLSLLPAYLLTLQSGVHLSEYAIKVIYLTFLLVLGVIHIFTFSKWLHFLNTPGSMVSFFYSFCLALLIGLLTILLFPFSGLSKPQLAASAACSFLLPVAILQSWNAFDYLSAKTYAPWYATANLHETKTAKIFLNSLQIKVMIKLRYPDMAECLIAVTVPSSLQLGKMFQEFLIDREEEGTKIELCDEKQLCYGWRFLVKKPLFSRLLDPDSTMEDNKIKQFDTIIAERITR